MMTENLENDDELELEQDSDGAESVEDSARAVLEELSGETETDRTNEGTAVKKSKEPAVDTSEAARILANSKRPKKRQIVDASQLQTESGKEAASEPPLEPPQRFPVEYKEQFHKLPRPVQAQALEFWNGMESNMTKRLQEASRYVQKYQQVDQLMQHYVPLIHESGFTETQFLGEMFATWKNLKENPVGTVQKIIQNLGITPDQLAGQQNHQVQQHIPANLLTTDEFERKLEEREQRVRSQMALQNAVNEVAQLRNERDLQTGTYKYPELWDDTFLQRVQPLVKYHRETHPEISVAEATRRAVVTHRSQLADAGSPSPMNTRLTPQDEIQRIKQASVSVRPRGNGTIPTLSQAKRGESVRESAEAILAEFSRH
jgi:hypothetical protein